MRPVPQTVDQKIGASIIWRYVWHIARSSSCGGSCIWLDMDGQSATARIELLPYWKLLGSPWQHSMARPSLRKLVC